MDPCVPRSEQNDAKAGPQKCRVLILGGGFGGIYAASEMEKLLRRRKDVNVTLVTRDNFFSFTPMLHEVAGSDLDISTIINPLRKLLARVNTFIGNIEAIDLSARSVWASHGLAATSRRRSEARRRDPFASRRWDNSPRSAAAPASPMCFGIRFSGFIAWWLWRTVDAPKPRTWPPSWQLPPKTLTGVSCYCSTSTFTVTTAGLNAIIGAAGPPWWCAASKIWHVPIA
jgi:hypothetical protein